MISVCLATYNGEKYVLEQIMSILCQLSMEDEVIISDDGSTDQTISIIKNIDDSRIKIFLNNGHCYTKNFENALMKASGDYIFLCDQDDIWEENKVGTVMNVFQSKQCDFVVTDAKVVNQKKDIIIESYFEYCHVKRGYLKNLLSTSYIGACMAFKRQILERVLPIPEKQIYIAHDYWIACIAERYYKTELIYKPLLLYRRHDNNASPGVFHQSKLNYIQKVCKRIYTHIQVIHRRK